MFFLFFFFNQFCYGGALSLWSSLDRNIKGWFSWKCFMDNVVWNTFMLSCTVNDFDLHLGRITSCVESCSLKSAPNMQPEGTVCCSTLGATTEDWFGLNFIVCALVILPYTLPSILGLPETVVWTVRPRSHQICFHRNICHSFLMDPLWDSCNGRQCIWRQLSPQTCLPPEVEPSQAFWSLRFASPDGCRSGVSAIWHRGNTANHRTRLFCSDQLCLVCESTPRTIATQPCLLSSQHQIRCECSPNLHFNAFYTGQFP